MTAKDNWKKYFKSMSDMVCLPVADVRAGHKRIIGSATFLMPGVFLTAKHLPEQYIKDHENLDITLPDWSSQDMDVSFNLEILQPLKGLGLVVWHVAKVHLIANSDLAILVADKCSGKMAEQVCKLNPRVQIDLHMPRVGSRIVSLGYPNMKNLQQADGQSKHVLAMRTSEGVVEDIDTSITRRTPRFQTNAPIDGGMSGGPVFNEQGRLCGINSDGLTPTAEHPFYTSFVIPIHTAFASKVELNADVGEEKRTTTLLELCMSGAIDSVGLEHFIIRNDEMLWDSRNIKCKSCPEVAPSFQRMVTEA